MLETLRLRIWLTAALMNCLLSVAVAQLLGVTGKITSIKGEPLVMANIAIKGSSIGTISDAGGNFQIEATPDDVLIISYIGYKSREIMVDGNAMAITLAPEGLSDWQEATVYRETDSGIPCLCLPSPPDAKQSKLNSHEYAFLGNIYHPYQILRGRIPGLTIARPSGDPLGFFDVQQRGLHSIFGSTEPLIVIDGLPGASWQTIDPQDIESIAVLRDPAQAAMYGIRGANSVISIKTRLGPDYEKLQVRYGGYLSLEQATRKPNVLSADEYRRLANTPGFPYGSPSNDLGSSTNWFDEITRTGVSQAHQLALGGRVNNTGYRIALNYREVNGVAPNSGFNQANVLAQLSQSLLKNRLRLQGGGNFTRRNFTDIHQDVFYYAALMNPTAPVRINKDYYRPQVFDLINPVALLEQIQNEGQHDVFSWRFGGDWDIASGLKAQVRYAAQLQSYDRNYVSNLSPDLIPNTRSRSKVDLSNKFLETAISYQVLKKKHDLLLTGGYNYQTWTNDFGAAFNYDLMRLGLRYTNIGFPNNNAASEPIAYKTTTELAAFFGRLVYRFDDWLKALVSLRREGASRLGENNRWGNFPALGVGIDLASLVKLSFARQLQLRASYGITGNLPVDGIYARQIFRPQNATVFYNGNFIPIVTSGNNPNPNLKWEERREFNSGLDFTAKNERFHLSVDYYRGRTNDLLYDYFVPSPPNVFIRQHENMIDFAHQGVEIALQAVPVARKGFGWEISANFAANSTSVAAIRPSQGNAIEAFTPLPYYGTFGCCQPEWTEIRAGERLGRLLAWEVANDNAASPIPRDQNGDGIIDAKDLVGIGSGLPQFTYGLANTLRWGTITLNFFLRGVSGHSVLNTHRRALSNPSNFGRYNLHVDALATPSKPATTPVDRRFVENASFLCLENLVLAYDFNLRQQSVISNLKLYLAAQNLFTLTNYSGTDPEVRLQNRGQAIFFNPDPLVTGVDARLGYFPTRTFTLGIQTVF